MSIGTEVISETSRGEAIEHLLRLLATYARAVRLYAAGHQRVATHERELERSLGEVLTETHDTLRLDVRDGVVEVDGLEGGAAAPRAKLGAALHLRGVRSVVLRCGTTLNEVRRLLELIQTKRQELLGAGGVQGIIEIEPFDHIELALDASVFATQQDDDGELAPADDDGELAPANERAPDNEPAGETTVAQRLAREAIVAHLGGHVPARGAALALCNLLSSAADAAEYRARRKLLFEAARSKGIIRDYLAEAILGLVRGERHNRFESTIALALEVAARAEDSSLIGKLVTTHRRPHLAEVREVGYQLAASTDAFDRLAFMVGTPGLGSEKAEFAVILARLGEERRGDFERWALTNRSHFLQPDVIYHLLEIATPLVAPILRRILLSGNEAERRVVVGQLVRKGTPKSLRILVLGMPAAEDERPADMILALGRFHDALAIGMLREIVHRCNTGRFRRAEAEAAIRALHASTEPEAREFLCHVRRKREFGLQVYRRELRDMSDEILEEVGAAA